MSKGAKSIKIVKRQINLRLIVIALVILLQVLAIISLIIFNKGRQDNRTDNGVAMAEDIYKYSEVNLKDMDTQPTEFSAKDLEDVTKVHTKFYNNDSDTRYKLRDWLVLNELSVFYNSLYVDENSNLLVLESAFDYDDVKTLLEENNLTSYNDYNAFIKECKYSDSSAQCKYPEYLIQNKMGNCNAFTLLTYIFLKTYYPDINMEFVTSHDASIGYNHIYLKIYDGDNDAYIFDATRGKYLIQR